MRAVIQRVNHASVTIDGKLKSSIQQGLLVLLGVEEYDTEEDAEWLAMKVIQMRIFNDEEGKMNLSMLDVQGQLLVVSQFTLHASTKKGNRPSFIQAARPEKAIPLYEYFLQLCKKLTGVSPESGTFGADMKVSLENDGPVTIIIDSQNKV